MVLLNDMGAFFNRPSLAMLVVPSLCFFIAIFIVYPLASQIVIELVCNRLYADDVENKDCTSAEVSKQAALITLYCELAINIPAFFTSGLYGKMCDKNGRRVVMLLSMCGFMGFLVCLISIAYFEALADTFLFYLLAGYFFFGIMGSNTAFQMASFLYAADITEGKAFAVRSHVYSVLESCLFVAKVLGPLCSGVWAKETNFIQPLVGGMTFVLLGISWTSFVMKDSVSDAVIEKNRTTQLSVNFVQSMDNIKYLVTMKPISGKGRSPVPLLFASFFLYYIVYMADGVITIFYTKYEFGWSSDTIGYYFSTGSSLQIVSMTLVPYLFIKMSGRDVSDIYWILVGYAARSLFYLLLPFYRDPRLLFANTVLLLLTGPPTPRARAAIINSVRYQSKAMSAFAAAQALGLLCSPIFNAIYSATVYDAPGATYFVFSSLCAAATSLAIYVVSSSDLRQNLPGHTLSPRTISVAKNSYSVDRLNEIIAASLGNDSRIAVDAEEPLLAVQATDDQSALNYPYPYPADGCDSLRDSIVTISGTEGGDGGGLYDGAAPQEMYGHLR